METKICTCCKIEFPKTLEYFNKDGNWLRYICRNCSKIKHKLWSLNNKEYRKEYVINYKNIQKYHDNKRVIELSDSIIINRIRRHSNLEKKDINIEMIETKRLLLKLKRELKIGKTI